MPVTISAGVSLGMGEGRNKGLPPPTDADAVNNDADNTTSISLQGLMMENLTI